MQSKLFIAAAIAVSVLPCFAEPGHIGFRTAEEQVADQLAEQMGKLGEQLGEFDKQRNVVEFKEGDYVVMSASIADDLVDRAHRLTMLEKKVAGQRDEIIELKRKVSGAEGDGGVQKQVTILHAKVRELEQRLDQFSRVLNKAVTK